MYKKIYCNDCMSDVMLNLPGDLRQYTDMLIECPCGTSSVVPKASSDGHYELYHLSDLEPPKNILEDFIEALNSDKNFYKVWKANLTMFICDSGVSLEIAEKAAKNILDHILLNATE